ncbi:MAG: hypothetical protein JWM47_1562 [Acidimicrobiales bacterium]|nr:hypothetical protein [Acidimicrobiales bacterium]
MTDPRQPLTDEDLSALLDGASADGVAERVEADPRARARLDALRAAREAVAGATVAGLDRSAVDQLIGRALAVADEPTAGPDAGTGGVVAPLRPSRRHPGGVPPLLVAAAVVLLVGVGLVLVWSGRGGTPDRDAASRATEITATADGADSGAKSSTAGAGDAKGAPATPTQQELSPYSPPTTAATDATAGSNGYAAGLVELGRFETPEDLRGALKAGFPTAARSTDLWAERGDADLTEASVDRCDALVRALFEIEGQARQRGVATVDGATALVYTYAYTLDEEPDVTTLTAAADTKSCNVLVSFVR